MGRADWLLLCKVTAGARGRWHALVLWYPEVQDHVYIKSAIGWTLVKLSLIQNEKKVLPVVLL